MAAFTEVCDANKKKLLAENYTEVNEAAKVRASWLILKIKNHIARTECTRETVDSILAKILSGDELAQSVFMKDPSKQNLHEDTQIEWIRKHEAPDVVALPKQNGPYLEDHRLLQGGSGDRQSGTKTLDAYSSSRREYYILKHTNGRGGHQDNQYRDAAHSMREVVGYLTDVPAATERFTFGLDGSYYTAKKLTGMRALVPEALRDRIRVISVASLIPPA